MFTIPLRKSSNGRFWHLSTETRRYSVTLARGCRAKGPGILDLARQANQTGGNDRLRRTQNRPLAPIASPLTSLSTTELAAIGLTEFGSLFPPFQFSL
jgi:hypothetical protein